jgi:uncharacterized protein (DUF983 family)
LSAEAGRACVLLTFWRGVRLRCPACGARTLFRAYLKLNETCPACGADFTRSETADVAPYVTVMLIGLIGMAPILALAMHAGEYAELMLTPALLFALVLALVLLPRVKGVLAALLWRARREM